jgi:hypothetical protein
MNSKISIRERILTAITAHDNSPIITPVQLADALALAVESITNAVAPAPQKDWLNKTEVKRKYALSEYALRKILNNCRISTKAGIAGRLYFNAADFDRAYRAGFTK